MNHHLTASAKRNPEDLLTNTAFKAVANITESNIINSLGEFNLQSSTRMLTQRSSPREDAYTRNVIALITIKSFLSEMARSRRSTDLRHSCKSCQPVLTLRVV